jgi:hypothetical protein
MKTFIFLLALLLNACNSSTIKFDNNEFAMAVDDYLIYVDSVNYKPDFDYIYIEAYNFKDSTAFRISLVGGSYDFLNEPNRIIDFGKYKGIDILLIGDFPNEIVNIKRNTRLNTMDEIVKQRYPEDYKKYLKDEHSVGPLIYDNMNMTLVFKKDKLISCKKQYN